MKGKSRFRKGKRNNIILWMLIVVMGLTAIIICAIRYSQKEVIG